jgi:glutamyl-tRNA reductase
VEIAKIFEGAAIPFEHFTDHMEHADIVISSTGAPHFIITRSLAEQVIRNRRNKPVFFIDIAVPRDVDPSVNDIDNAFVYDIDDLQQVIDANMRERMKEAGRAEEIVDREVQAFCTRIQSREVAPTIVLLRETLDKVRREEIERYRKLLRDMPAEHQQATLAAIDQVTQSLMNKILHHPITQMKEMSADPNGAEFIEAVRKIFNIKLQ